MAGAGHRHGPRHAHPFLGSAQGVAGLLLARDPGAVSLRELASMLEAAGFEPRGVHDEFLYLAGQSRLEAHSTACRALPRTFLAAAV